MEKILARAKRVYRDDKAKPQTLVSVSGDYIEHSKSTRKVGVAISSSKKQMFAMRTVQPAATAA